MAGALVSLFRRRVFDFASLDRGGSLAHVIVKVVPTFAYVNGVIVIRVHSSTISSGNQISIATVETAPTPEDPSRNFTVATNLSTIDIDSSVTDNLLTDGIAIESAEAIQLVVTGSRGNAASTVAELSADVVLRE